MIREGHMQDRTDMLDAFYGQANEDTRLSRSRHGQLEYGSGDLIG